MALVVKVAIHQRKMPMHHDRIGLQMQRHFEYGIMHERWSMECQILTR